MFRERHPLSWTYHRNSSRWSHNVLAPEDVTGVPGEVKEYAEALIFPLPAPLPLPVDLAATIRSRLSCRQFVDAPLGLEQLATILKLGYGVTGSVVLDDVEHCERPVPSAGSLYPLELYVLVRAVASLSPGIYHYAVVDHALEQLRALELPPRFLGHLFMGQPYIGAAGAVTLIAAVVERTMQKYSDRGYRYILMEAGQAAQNMNLTAAALNLGSLNLGGFFDQELASLIGLDLEAEVPLYGIALGRPQRLDRATLRSPPVSAVGA